MPQTKPAYTEEFKQEVLAYLASTSNSLDVTAKHFGISANSLGEWRRRAHRPSLKAVPVSMSQHLLPFCESSSVIL